MRRRTVLALIGGSAIALPWMARAQDLGRVRRVGVLTGYRSDAETGGLLAAFRDVLARLGWVEGRNILFEYRWTAGDAARTSSDAAELVQIKPDVILVQGSSGLAALAPLTRTIPIVAGGSDLVGSGFAETMARPGGNITGFNNFEFAIGARWLELLKEIVPHVERVLVLSLPGNAGHRGLLGTIEAAAPALGVRITKGEFRDSASIERAIAGFALNANGGLIVLPNTLTRVRYRDLVLALARERRLPAMYPERLYVAAGGLACYSIDLVENFRRMGVYVDRILRGAAVGDLPVQNPTKFDFVINLKTARSLDLTVPPSFLARADEVIE